MYREWMCHYCKSTRFTEQCNHKLHVHYPIVLKFRLVAILGRCGNISSKNTEGEVAFHCDFTSLREYFIQGATTLFRKYCLFLLTGQA